jgi:hypothetical protein
MWRDLLQDFPVWENKAYLERPRLAEGDGPIMRYRRWARQFYTLPQPPDEHGRHPTATPTRSGANTATKPDTHHD